MGCSNCSTCEVSEKRGSANSTVFDWLYQIDAPKSDNSNLVEVQFKRDRKDFYINTDNIDLNSGDWVAVQGDKSGHDIGKVTMKGELVALQIKRKNRDVEKDPIKKLYRIASENDLQKWKDAVANEDEILVKAKRIIEDHKLEMKLTDVEFQGDNSKATFYYTAEKRVDFRELIREYSRNFGVRVEMRQIGVRQEAAKIGGIGSCGRELCCSTWMTDFPSVSTNAARYQQLSINPQKISGQCGRLKCCLNFELDGYTEALKGFPTTKVQLKSKKGSAKFVKLDVFKGVLFYFNPDTPGDFLELTIDNVNKIIALNKKGEIPASFESFIVEVEQKEVSFEDAMGQDNIGRFDKKKAKPKRQDRRNKFKKNRAKARNKKKSSESK
ncbi:regulatory iron-sulfur-containing complex subunit RicT [Flavobacteriales bacterium]|jgi:cell fate regulator YaaT (PSP1 superfamily)|nr:regulatory iron-sulfur-containing complex subunit RicT [Flavobacteriales bacterium]